MDDEKEYSLIKPQSLEAVASEVRKRAIDPESNWSYGSFTRPDGSTHAGDEMQCDRIDVADAPFVLKACRVTQVDWNDKYREWRYRAEGRNVDGIRMIFVVTLTEDPKGLEIVTAWAKGSK